MKVLEDSTENWSKTIICGDCESKLEVNSNDVRFRKRRHSSVHGPHEDWFTDLYYVVCGVCKVDIKLADAYEGSFPTKDLPISIIKRAYNRYFCR